MKEREEKYHKFRRKNVFKKINKFTNIFKIKQNIIKEKKTNRQTNKNKNGAREL